MKRIVNPRFILHKLGRMLAYATALCITLFIVASSYETASGKDAPFLESIQPVDLSVVRPTLSKQRLSQLTDRNREGMYGRPEILRMVIDKKPVKLVIAPGLSHDGQWLARANTSHALYTTDTKNGNAGDMLVYMTQSWRTIADPNAITRGSNIFIDTNQAWRYMFRVQDIQTVARDAQMLIPAAKSTQVVVCINQPGEARSVVIRAQFVSLLNVAQI